MRIGIALAAACMLAGGCMSVEAPAQQATFDNVRLLQSSDIPPIAVGTFELAPGLPAQMDKSVAIRLDSMKAPGGGTFSGYLRQTFETELAAAGKLDPQAAVSISGQLTRSEIKTNPAGGGTLAARLKAVRGGQVVFEKELSVSDAWEFQFIAAIAVPKAMDHYTALYPKLVTALFNDPEFRRAVKA
jgi:hypothetical protein